MSVNMALMIGVISDTKSSAACRTAASGGDGDVVLHGGQHAERAAALDVRPHGEQHPPHVRVDDDRVRRLVRVLGAVQRPALHAVLRVGHRVLVADLGDAEPLHADAEPRRVHHGEHGGEAPVRLAHQPALRLVEGHGAGGGALMPILCSMEVQDTPFRTPGRPSSVGRNFGTRTG
jgi:hypothetical protein